WISFGEHAWLDLHRLAARWAPGYGGFRNPTRALMLTAFCVAALAAEGLARLREQPRSRWLVLGGLGILSVCVALAYAFPQGNAVLERGWEGVTGYGPTPIDRVLRLFEATWTGSIRPPRQINEDENFPRFRTDSPLTPLLGAPLIAANREASVPPIARDGAVRLYRLPALPRVFWTSAWRDAPDERSYPLLAQAAHGALAALPEP